MVDGSTKIRPTQSIWEAGRKDGFSAALNSKFPFLHFWAVNYLISSRREALDWHSDVAIIFKHGNLDHCRNVLSPLWFILNEKSTKGHSGPFDSVCQETGISAVLHSRESQIVFLSCWLLDHQTILLLLCAYRTMFALHHCDSSWFLYLHSPSHSWIRIKEMVKLTILDHFCKLMLVGSSDSKSCSRHSDASILIYYYSYPR